MADAVALGEVGETKPVPRPHRREVDSLEAIGRNVALSKR
jgi:hypothetical protein